MNKTERLKEARLAADLSKSELAREIGVSPQAVGLWEKGETKNLKNDHLFALEKVTGYSAKWLSDGKGDKFSKNFNLSTKEVELLRKFRKASDEEKRLIERLFFD